MSLTWILSITLLPALILEAVRFFLPFSVGMLLHNTFSFFFFDKLLIFTGFDWNLVFKWEFLTGKLKDERHAHPTDPIK